MVGHSEIVGKPAAFMLMARGRHGDRLPPHDALGGRAFAPRRRRAGGGRQAEVPATPTW